MWLSRESYRAVSWRNRVSAQMRCGSEAQRCRRAVRKGSLDSPPRHPITHPVCNFTTGIGAFLPLIFLVHRIYKTRWQSDDGRSIPHSISTSLSLNFRLLIFSYYLPLSPHNRQPPQSATGTENEQPRRPTRHHRHRNGLPLIQPQHPLPLLQPLLCQP